MVRALQANHFSMKLGPVFSAKRKMIMAKLSSLQRKWIFLRRLLNIGHILSAMNPRQNRSFFINYFHAVRMIHQNRRGVEATRVHLILAVNALFALDFAYMDFCTMDYPSKESEPDWHDPHQWWTMVTRNIYRRNRVKPTGVLLYLILLVPLNVISYYWLYLQGYKEKCCRTVRKLVEPRTGKSSEFRYGLFKWVLLEKGVTFVNKINCFLVILRELLTRGWLACLIDLARVAEMSILIMDTLHVYTYLRLYPPTTPTNILGLFLVLGFMLLVCTFGLSLMHSQILAASFAYILKQALNIRMRDNNRRNLHPRRLITFQRSHLVTMYHFFKSSPLLGNILMVLLATNYPINTVLMAIILNDPFNVMTLAYLPLVSIQFFGFVTIHLAMAKLSWQLHDPFKRFLMVCFQKFVEDRQRRRRMASVRMNRNNLFHLQTIRQHIKLTLFGQSFHTSNRYGLRYGSIGVIDMQSFSKVGVLSS